MASNWCFDDTVMVVSADEHIAPAPIGVHGVLSVPIKALPYCDCEGNILKKLYHHEAVRRNVP